MRGDTLHALAGLSGGLAFRRRYDYGNEIPMLKLVVWNWQSCLSDTEAINAMSWCRLIPAAPAAAHASFSLMHGCAVITHCTLF
jgi:hypothetical protein